MRLVIVLRLVPGGLEEVLPVYFACKVSRKTEYQVVIDFKERKEGVPGHEILY